MATAMQSTRVPPETDSSVLLAYIFVAQDGEGNAILDKDGNETHWYFYVDESGQFLGKKISAAPPVV